MIIRENIHAPLLPGHSVTIVSTVCFVVMLKRSDAYVGRFLGAQAAHTFGTFPGAT